VNKVGLVIYFIIAWFLISYFCAMQKGLPNIVSILTFISLQIIHINLFTILSFKLKYFVCSTKPVKFISIILYRDFIVPVMLLIFVHFLYRFKSVVQRILIAGMVLSLFLFTEQLLVFWGFISNRHWSFIHTIFFDSSLMVVSVLLAVTFKRLLPTEIKMNGGLSDL
jgi:hypothetical protein